MPDVSILICVHGKLELTRRCLDAIAATAPAGRYEVVVVDNASPDGSGDALEALAADYPAPLKVVRSAENLGFVGGNNLAAEHATGTHLVLLNNDTEPQPGWLEALLAIAERDPATGAVGAKLVYPDGRLQEAGGIVFADASGWNYGRGGDPDDPRYTFVREVDYCSAACLLVPRAVWDAVGGFDERYAPAYYEDTDLCFAVRERGLKVVYQPARRDRPPRGRDRRHRHRLRLQAAPGRQPRALPREVGRGARASSRRRTRARPPREPPRRRASACSSSTRSCRCTTARPARGACTSCCCCSPRPATPSRSSRATCSDDGALPRPARAGRDRGARRRSRPQVAVAARPPARLARRCSPRPATTPRSSASTTSPPSTSPLSASTRR